MTIFNPAAEHRCARCGQWWWKTHTCPDLGGRAIPPPSGPFEVTTTDKLTAERDALRAEVERLRAEVEAQYQALITGAVERDDARAEVERLRAENAALAAWQCIHSDGKTGLMHDECGNASCAKDAAIDALRAAPVQQAEPVAVLNIQHFRNDPAMQNHDFDLLTTLPPGTHALYLRPHSAEVQRLEAASRKVLQIVDDIGRRAFTLSGWMDISELRAALDALEGK